MQRVEADTARLSTQNLGTAYLLLLHLALRLVYSRPRTLKLVTAPGHSLPLGLHLTDDSLLGRIHALLDGAWKRDAQAWALMEMSTFLAALFLLRVEPLEAFETVRHAQ